MYSLGFRTHWPDKGIYRLIYNLWFFLTKLGGELWDDTYNWIANIYGDVKKRKASKRTLNVLKKTQVDFRKQRILNSFASVKMFFYNVMVVDMQRTAVKDEEAPNPTVINYNSRQVVKFQVKTHKSLEDRFAAAGTFLDFMNGNIPLYVDPMSNEANTSYGGLPERMAIVFQNKVIYIGGIGPYLFDIPEMEQALQNFC